MPLQYPLQLNFKLIALAPRIRMRDAAGNEVFYVHQKTFKLKEDVRIYSDESKSREMYNIRADRIIDFSAKYHIYSSETGAAVGAIKHRGLRSIWNATYEIYDPNDQQSHLLKEDNPWIKVLDAISDSIPFVGLFTGYIFNPTYTVYRGVDKESGQPVMRLSKKPAFFESSFQIEKLDESVSGDEELRILLAIIMAVQMERSRG
ncbi:MAG TPA: hypothetical protein VK003_20320 [Oceanobacillus sp.]|nr:hypothetical protein [Oceanobacillus sp.]